MHNQEQDERIERLERLVSQLRSSNEDGTGTPENDTISGWIDTISTSTCIAAFRLHMLPQFPFLYLPASDGDLTAERPQRDRPFLFRAILCVAASTRTDRMARAAEIYRALCESALLHQNNQGESMDLLLAVLTLAAWGWDYHYYNGGGGISLPRLIMLAMSLVGEMRLDKPAPQRLRSMAGFMPGVIQGLDHGHEGSSPTTGWLSLEQTRAVLGCFVLSSVVSDHFGLMDGLQWTRQMEEGLSALSESKECKSDALLVLQVRIQLLTTKACEIRKQQEHGERQGSTPGVAATLVQIDGLRSQLQEIQGSLPEAYPEHFQILQAYISHTELCILESSTPHLDPSLRAGNARAALSAIKICLSNLLALLSPSGLPGGSNISFIHWEQLTHCLTSLQHLLANPDQTAVVEANDLHPVLFLLGQFAERLEQLAGVEGAESLADAGEAGKSGEDAFRALAVGLRKLLEGVRAGGGGTAGEEGVDLGRGENADGDGAAAGDGAGSVEPNLDVLVPQKGYFWNKRFWLDKALFSETGE